MSGRSSWRPGVVVCGTKFGRVYLSAFRRAGFPFELKGILARGSERSRACAAAYRVPLFTDPSALPIDVDIACVVVGASLNGGRGAELAQALMARGIHVLQEHPLHEVELGECLRRARQAKVVYRLNTHYVHVPPVRRFIETCHELFRRQRPVFVDAACGFQTAYTLLDILGAALQRLGPWALSGPLDVPVEVRSLGNTPAPFRCLAGVIGGVPLTLRVQHELDPGDPDNYIHLSHRIAIGTEGGVITLVGGHGPMLWSPRAHLPGDARDTAAIDDSTAWHFSLPSSSPLGEPAGPSFREILTSLWPDAVAHALIETRDAILGRENSFDRGQYYLTLCRIWQDMTARLGPPLLARRSPPQILSAHDLMPAVAPALVPSA